MKAKNKISFSFLPYTLFVLMMVLSSCSNHELVYGYIPVGEALQTHWAKKSSVGNFNLTRCIKVVADNGDTISAIAVDGTFSRGGYLVKYRDSYPLCKDKKVFVQLIKHGDIYYVNDADLEPFE